MLNEEQNNRPCKSLLTLKSDLKATQSKSLDRSLPNRYRFLEKKSVSFCNIQEIRNSNTKEIFLRIQNRNKSFRLLTRSLSNIHDGNGISKKISNRSRSFVNTTSTINFTKLQTNSENIDTMEEVENTDQERKISGSGSRPISTSTSIINQPKPLLKDTAKLSKIFQFQNNTASPTIIDMDNLPENFDEQDFHNTMLTEDKLDDNEDVVHLSTSWPPLGAFPDPARGSAQMGFLFWDTRKSPGSFSPVHSYYSSHDLDANSPTPRNTKCCPPTNEEIVIGYCCCHIWPCGIAAKIMAATNIGRRGSPFTNTDVFLLWVSETLRWYWIFIGIILYALIIICVIFFL